MCGCRCFSLTIRAFGAFGELVHKTYFYTATRYVLKINVILAIHFFVRKANHASQHIDAEREAYSINFFIHSFFISISSVFPIFSLPLLAVFVFVLHSMTSNKFFSASLILRFVSLIEFLGMFMQKHESFFFSSFCQSWIENKIDFNKKGTGSKFK